MKRIGNKEGEGPESVIKLEFGNPNCNHLQSNKKIKKKKKVEVTLLVIFLLHHQLQSSNLFRQEAYSNQSKSSLHSRILSIHSRHLNFVLQRVFLNPYVARDTRLKLLLSSW
ncbi:hypothetical protein M9H77_26636 [Catharanthus roseus]|uniref:Uncharacterized protein n=1 Tax=Catharanthus roseus TaxID=4058 RepID=A0ACC0ACY3_CATRO|nr:hypothetical protein M9H77_26636 [Catharanthus roseus]